jgi:hypothetical protein
MQPYQYPAYPYPNPNGATIPVRYMVPTGYRQNSPPFANQSFDRYATVPPAVRPPPSMGQPRFPPGYQQGYPPPGMPMPPMSTMMPVRTSPRPQQRYPQPQQQPPEQLQPPQPYYYNPYGANGGNPTTTPGPVTPAPKKGAKEYKDKAFTIAPDGARSEAIKGLVSNNDINDLLKHKGTKVKVSKIYRISKSKPEIRADSSSDEELPLPMSPARKQSIQPPSPARQQSIHSLPPQPTQRPISSSSSGSHCSTCSNCSCSECRSRGRSHVYDDCPECRAELSREQARRQRRK